MLKEKNLQDQFLDTLCKERMPVAIYLVNGIKLQGKIESFDASVLFLENGSVSQLVYKHTVSTIVPTEKVKLNFAATRSGNSED